MTQPTVSEPDSALAPMVLPRYGASTLADLLPAIGAHLSLPDSGEDRVGLASSDRYVVVMVDGLGWHLVRSSISHLPYFASLLGDARPITAGVPSTTVTSLASLGTGLPPGQHGLVGYTSRVPETGELLNGLTWEAAPDPHRYQSKPTFFERAAAAGVSVSSVSLERFAGTGLTVAALRGAAFVGFGEDTADEERIRLVVAAVQRADRAMVYAYERELDHSGHVDGCSSAAWRKHLIRIERMCERLRQALPDDVRMIITGDHGMIDIPTDHQIIAEDNAALMAGVSALAGECRFRQIYVDSERPSAVANRWRDELGDKAWVRTRDEAIDEGWFGSVDDRLRERYGHVLVALRSDHAVMTRQFPRELSLIGMHGSMTAAEMAVPLFCD
jgi:predicted AlkP superfamily pyrophosphatase or phosphodiesterase